MTFEISILDNCPGQKRYFVQGYQRGITPHYITKYKFETVPKNFLEVEMAWTTRIAPRGSKFTNATSLGSR